MSEVSRGDMTCVPAGWLKNRELPREHDDRIPLCGFATDEDLRAARSSIPVERTTADDRVETLDRLLHLLWDHPGDTRIMQAVVEVTGSDNIIPATFLDAAQHVDIVTHRKNKEPGAYSAIAYEHLREKAERGPLDLQAPREVAG